MTLINCETCGKEIAQQARMCPHCGAKRKVGGGFSKFLLNLALILLILILISMVVAGLDRTAGNEESNSSMHTENVEALRLTPQCDDPDALSMLKLDALSKMGLEASISGLEDIEERRYELGTMIRDCKANAAITIPSENVIVLGFLTWKYQLVDDELNITSKFEQVQIMSAGMPR